MPPSEYIKVVGHSRQSTTEWGQCELVERAAKQTLALTSRLLSNLSGLYQAGFTSQSIQHQLSFQ